MNGEQLDKLTGQLYSTTPLIGGLLRRRAAKALARDASSQAARALAEAVIRSDDEQVRTIAIDALSRLSDQLCIDAACEVWASTRHADLARLLTEGNWVASQPAMLRVLSALKVGRLEIVTGSDVEVVGPFMEACDDADDEIAQQAALALRKLNRPEAQEELCQLVVEQDHQLARGIAIEVQYAPRDATQRAIFYFLTEQWEKYESLDFDRSLLKAAYQSQGHALQARIAAVARKAGRVELVEVVSGGRQGLRLGRMTDREWEAVLEVLVTGRRWEEVWRLAQEAPPRWSGRILRQMKAAGYIPDRSEAGLDYEKLAELAAGWNEVEIGRKSLEGHNLEVTGLTISPDGRVLASGSKDWTVRLWSLPDGEPIKTFKGLGGSVTNLAISSDGRVLASAMRDHRTVRLWSLPDGEPIKTLVGHTGGVTCLAISPDGRVLASGSWDDTVRLWSLPDGESIKTLEGHSHYACLAISPDGSVLASGGGPFIQDKTLRFSEDKTVRLWSLPDGEPIKTLEGHSHRIDCLAISPDGSVLASGGGSFFQDKQFSEDKTVRLWSLPDGKPLKTLEGHSGSVSCLAMSPDGRVLASGSSDTVRLWQLPDGEPIKTPEGDGGRVMCLAITPNGRVLASGSAGKAVQLWDPLLDRRLVRLLQIPIAQTSLADLQCAQRALHNGSLSDEQRKALEFPLELMRRHRRFDIEVGEAARHIEVGEFDIEIA